MPDPDCGAGRDDADPSPSAGTDVPEPAGGQGAPGAADDPAAAGDSCRPDPDTPVWPPLVRAAGCDRETLLRRIVGG